MKIREFRLKKEEQAVGKLKLFFEKDWSKAEKVLLLANCILGGIVFGILFSPLKGGIVVGSNNTGITDDEE